MERERETETGTEREQVAKVYYGYKHYVQRALTYERDQRKRQMCITVKMNCMMMHVNTEGFDIKTMQRERERERKRGRE